MQDGTTQKALSILSNWVLPNTHSAIVLGTGLGDFVSGLNDAQSISYADIPGFPRSTVEGHKGQLTRGTIKGVPVLVFEGRFHYYEGYSLSDIAFPFRLLKFLGVKRLLVSCAAGGLNPNYERSSLMVFSDHISLLPDNPLRGPHDPANGDRFPDMLHTYDAALRERAKSWLERNGHQAQEGVYICVPGPNLETPAEYRFLRTIGGDAVGMSTVPEVIVAHQAKIACFAVAAITDLCSPEHLKNTSLEEIISAAKKASTLLTGLFEDLVQS